ncbi:MAG: hypothetical protein AB7O57_16805 [Hyphomicrobiaceae bacterium]
MRVKYTTVIAILWIAIFWLALVGLDLVLPSRFSNDSTALMSIAETGGAEGWEESRSYANTADVFRLVPSGLLTPVLGLIGTLYLAAFMRPLPTVTANLVAVFLTAPTVAFCLVRLQKESLVAILVVLVLAALRRIRTPWLAMAAVSLLYGVYAWFFRAYYVPVALIAVGIYVWSRLPNDFRLLAIFLGGAALFAAPVSIFEALIGPRDTVNGLRLLNPDAFMRSAFFNPWPPDGPFHFLGSYVYALGRLNAPILFVRGLPEILLTIYMGVAFWVLWRSYCWPSHSARILASLFTAHVLFLAVFEPDLGSYFRHISSVVPYLVFGLMPRRSITA